MPAVIIIDKDGLTARNPSRQRCPIIKPFARVIFQRSAVASKRSGFGFRHAQASTSSCDHTLFSSRPKRRRARTRGSFMHIGTRLRDFLDGVHLEHRENSAQKSAEKAIIASAFQSLRPGVRAQCNTTFFHRPFISRESAHIRRCHRWIQWEVKSDRMDKQHRYEYNDAAHYEE